MEERVLALVRHLLSLWTNRCVGRHLVAGTENCRDGGLVLRVGPPGKRAGKAGRGVRCEGSRPQNS